MCLSEIWDYSSSFRRSKSFVEMPELFFPNGTTWSASTVTFNVLSFSFSLSPGLDAFLQYVRTWDGKYNSVETVALPLLCVKLWNIKGNFHWIRRQFVPSKCSMMSSARRAPRNDPWRALTGYIVTLRRHAGTANTRGVNSSPRRPNKQIVVLPTFIYKCVGRLKLLL